ncbi:MAG: RidA family protein [Hormoscilla sp.]
MFEFEFALLSPLLLLLSFEDSQIREIYFPSNGERRITNGELRITNGELFVTGHLASDPKTGDVVASPIDQQVRSRMDNLQLILGQAGTSCDFSLRDRAVMARVFITDICYFDIMNEIYASYFSNECLPCRTTIGVVGLAGERGCGD